MTRRPEATATRGPTRRHAAGARLAALVGSGALVVAGAALAARADQIQLIPGTTIKTTSGRISGQVTAETPAQVTIKPAVGEPQNVPVDQIESITYDNPTPSQVLATGALNAGDTAKAADLFAKVAAEAKGRPLVERAALFTRAELLADLAAADPAKADEAVAAFEGFARANANSRQIEPALSRLARLHLARGDAAKAEAAAAELARIPGAAELAAIVRARVQARGGAHAEASAALAKIAADAPKGSARAREALLAQAESLVALKQFAEAEAALRRVIDEASPEDVPTQAAAHNALGGCLRDAGRPKDALLAYLKTDILFARARDEHARALAQIAALWSELKEEARANEARQRLRDQYPGSPDAR